jgi:hypothetical protein
MSKQITVPQPKSLSMSHWPDQEKIQELADRTEAIVEHRNRLHDAWLALATEPSQAVLDQAKDALDWFVSSGMSLSVAKLAAECQPNDWVDDNGKARKAEVGKMLAVFVGSFPQSVPNPTVFNKSLLDDVMACKPNVFAALECTCRKIRTTVKFTPSISEIVIELKTQVRAWNARIKALGEVESDYDSLAELVAEVEKELAIPLIVGDRVREVTSSYPGTVTRQTTNMGSADFYILFDEVRERATWLPRLRLEKLVEGDDDFAAPPPDFG